MIVNIVRFKSGLTDDEVLAASRDRAPRYRALEGLVQKYYLRFPDTGEHGAVYLWESPEAMEEFRASDLGRTISTAFKVQGAPSIEKAELVMTLRQ
jgi:hypothetical protein